MSRYSGRCDLCSHIAGTGGWYDKNGTPAKIGDPDVRVYYSDEYQDFLEFKKQTDGTLYQHLRVEVTEWNQDFVAENCNNFKIIKHTKMVPDKRLKSGEKEVTEYSYIYFGKEYKSLKELNRKHVYIVKEIHFNTLLDLLPYYPYIVSSCCSSDGKQTVFISNISSVDEEENSALQCGWKRTLTDYYRQQLAEHYQEVVLRYYNPTGREIIEQAVFDRETRQSKLQNVIDDKFSVTWLNPDGKIFYTRPKVIDYEKGIIEISSQDLETFGDCVQVKYVKAEETKLFLS